MPVDATLYSRLHDPGYTRRLLDSTGLTRQQIRTRLGIGQTKLTDMLATGFRSYPDQVQVEQLAEDCKCARCKHEN